MGTLLLMMSAGGPGPFGRKADAPRGALVRYLAGPNVVKSSTIVIAVSICLAARLLSLGDAGAKSPF
jgi:hypothetical protein